MAGEPQADVARQARWLGAGALTGVVGALAGVALLVAVFVPDRVQAAPAPAFLEETTTSGIDHSYNGEFEFFVGGGVAVLDCDDNGSPDLYLAGGSSPAALYRNVSGVGADLMFTPVASPAAELTGVTGAYPLDFDSDGVVDLMSLRLGENVALRGLGDCRFERANESWGLDGGDEWTAAFSAKWELGEALPTVAFGNYLEFPVDRERGTVCSDNVLVRPDGDRYGDPLPLSPGFCTLSILFSDWDGSGRMDLRVANDRHYYINGSDQLWRVASGEAPRVYTPDDGWNDLRIWGMGIASQDVTGDGLPEFLVTSQGDNKLQTLDANADQPSFGDIAFEVGVTAHRPYVGDDTFPSTAWHPEFQDVNNDGFLDLLITKGNVEAMVGYATADPNNLLIGQPGGSFIEGGAESGVASTARSRGAALVDFNLDGRLDLIVVNRVEPTQIWRNVGDTGNWLAVRLQQPTGNTHAVGAFIEAEVDGRTVIREVTVGGGHAGDQLGWVHFGLGEATEADLLVRWPDGTATESTHVANQFVILQPGMAPQPWTP